MEQAIKQRHAAHDEFEKIMRNDCRSGYSPERYAALAHEYLEKVITYCGHWPLTDEEQKVFNRAINILWGLK